MDSAMANFYSRPGIHLEIYDAQTEAGWGSVQSDAAFYLEEARRCRGPILELACGTGRILLPLLATGMEAHGLDISASMLNVLRMKTERLRQDEAARVHLHQGSMSDFELGTKFSLIIIGFRSFQALLTPEDQRKCLTSIQRHLAEDGRAILNLFDPRYDLVVPGRAEGDPAQRSLRNPATGHAVTVEVLMRENEPMTQTFKEQWRFTERADDGVVLRQEIEELQLRWTFRQEMRHLVELCGLQVEAEYSDFQRSAPAYGREQVWVLRRR